MSYGKLDLWDISHIFWWETKRETKAEKQLITYFQPYLNLKKEYDFYDEILSIKDVDGKFQIIEKEEKNYRLKPYNRIKQKLSHIERMCEKIKFANHSSDTQKTLYKHFEILENNLDEFLDIKKGNS